MTDGIGSLHLAFSHRVCPKVKSLEPNLLSQRSSFYLATSVQHHRPPNFNKKTYNDSWKSRILQMGRFRSKFYLAVNFLSWAMPAVPKYFACLSVATPAPGKSGGVFLR